MSFMTNGLRWMHSIADPKQHAQTLDNVLGASEHNGRQVGAVPVMEPAPRVGAGPTIHGNDRPPVVPDGPPRRYGGRPSETRRVGKEGAKGRGDDVMAAVRGKGIPASYGGGMARRVEDVPRRRSALFCLPQ